MKKKLLPLAMLAGLAGAAGTAQAVHVNPEGLGDALIYPFYTVEGGQDTYISVVNTTNETKAVKVRFIEAMNSREVLDFNLYLSAYDHWSVAVSTNADGEPGLVIGSGFDSSCTVPSIKRLSAEGLDFVPFRNTLFSSEYENEDGGPEEVTRGNEGYVEIIEMGILGTTSPTGVVTELGADPFGAAEAADHGTTGVPGGCDTLEQAWLGDGYDGTGLAQGLTGTGEWAIEDDFGNPLPVPGNPNSNMEAATGGLYGYGVLIDTQEGTNATYSAVALDSFFPTLVPVASLHSAPGDTLPTLAEGDQIAEIIDGSDIYELVFSDRIDAVSAALMRDTLSNDYVLASSINASTDWVVTFPTKRFYVDVPPASFVPGPFTNPWESETVDDVTTAQACEPINMTYWDREEQQPAVSGPGGGFDFSPRPPQVAPDVVGFNLCREANVISFQNASTPVADRRYSLDASERILSGFNTIYQNGWARIDFTANSQGAPIATRLLVGEDAGGDDYEVWGLPVVGFAVQKYSNGSVGDGAFYSGLIEHKYTRLIVPAIP